MNILLHDEGRVKRLLVRVPAWRRSAACVAAASFLLLSGCDGQGLSGQVVAVVNGEEITVPELNEEARSRGLVIGNDRAVRDALIQALVERKLLVQVAERRKLDRTPDYVLAQRRSNEILLAGKLVEAVDATRPDPSDAELVRFIRSRPMAFDRRVLVSVDRIRAPAGLKADLARALAEARSIDRAQSLLASNSVGAERRTEVWDSATLSPDVAEQLMRGVGAGPVLLQLPDQTILARVLQVTPQPTPAGDRLRFARELLRSERSRQDLQAMLMQEKSSASIRYQPSFAPSQSRPGAQPARD